MEAMMRIRNKAVAFCFDFKSLILIYIPMSMQEVKQFIVEVAAEALP